MLAARKDQENLVFSHQAGAAAKQQQQSQSFRTLQPKTPGTRYPKTPLKVPLNDENATHGFAGKSVLRPKDNNENVTIMGKGGRSNFVTPLGKSIAGLSNMSRRRVLTVCVQSPGPLEHPWATRQPTPKPVPGRQQA